MKGDGCGSVEMHNCETVASIDIFQASQAHHGDWTMHGWKQAPSTQLLIKNSSYLPCGSNWVPGHPLLVAAHRRKLCVPGECRTQDSRWVSLHTRTPSVLCWHEFVHAVPGHQCHMLHRVLLRTQNPAEGTPLAGSTPRWVMATCSRASWRLLPWAWLSASWSARPSPSDSVSHLSQATQSWPLTSDVSWSSCTVIPLSPRNRVPDALLWSRGWTKVQVCCCPRWQQTNDIPKQQRSTQRKEKLSAERIISTWSWAAAFVCFG